MAIGIQVTPAEGEHYLGASKFFGIPTLPKAWLDSFDEDEIFFCQLRLSELAAYDEADRLPHQGYLYIFLHTEGGLRPDVRYSAEQPELAVEDFNAAVCGYEHLTQGWQMAFCAAEEDAEGIRLFGTPSDWNYPEPPPKLLLQFDPLASEMGFLSAMDGFLYLFFGADERDFSKITLMEEYS